MDWVQDFFKNKYRNLKLTQNVSAEHTWYQSANAVVLTKDIASTLDHLSKESTADQIYIYQVMATIYQLM